MPGIRKYDYDTAMIGFRIKKSIKENNSTPVILKDLGEAFVYLASRFTEPEIDQLLKKHPLAAAVIEVLP